MTPDFCLDIYYFQPPALAEIITHRDPAISSYVSNTLDGPFLNQGIRVKT